MMRSILLAFVFNVLVCAGDRGLTPRARASDYQANQTTKDATLAASIVPARQIEKMFTAEIARHYIALEVAVYPQDGKTVNLGLLDFGLKIGDSVTYAERPRDIAAPWPDKTTVPGGPVTVLTDTGVVYSRSSDPVNGKRSGWGVYEGVGVTNDPRAATPPTPPRQDRDPQIVEERINEIMLPEGRTTAAVAGFLFFPQYKTKRHKGMALELQWSKDGTSAILRLVEK
jgi:hypothetical protein